MTKGQRLLRANEFLVAISRCGRRFFAHEGAVSQFHIALNGHIYLLDKYTKKMIYTHYAGRWRGFTGGGTLKNLCCCLRDFIQHGKTVNAGAFGGEHWGYGTYMQQVRDAAQSLGITAQMERERAHGGK